MESPALQALCGSIAAAVFWTGCASDQETMPGDPAIGIAELRVQQRDSSLQITGLDGSGALVAQLDLRVGMVDVPALGQILPGREIHLRVGSDEYAFVSGGLDPVFLPAPVEPALTSFVLDPYVSQVLERWSVRYAELHDWLAAGDEHRAPVVEEAYTACALPPPNIPLTFFTDGGFFAPCSGVGARSSCEDYVGNYAGLNQYSQLVQCNNDNRAVRACTLPFTTSQCGATGPNGCAVCLAWLGPTGGDTTCTSSSCAWVDPPPGGGGGGGSTGSCTQTSCFVNADCCSGTCSGGQCACAGSRCSDGGCCDNQTHAGTCDSDGTACLLGVLGP